jgi:hypothetical protein
MKKLSPLLLFCLLLLNTTTLSHAQQSNEELSAAAATPLATGGGKLVKLGGKLPLNLQTQLYYNIVRSDFGPEWQWRFQAQILLPKSIFSKK